MTKTTPEHRRRLRPFISTAILGALQIGVSGCTDTFRAGGPNAAAAGVRAEQLFSSLAARYTEITRDPKFEASRLRLTRATLTPSRSFNDTSLWTSRPSATERRLLVAADFIDGRYRLEQRTSLGPPLHPGSARHVISLEKLDGSAYRWDANVDFAIGTMTGDDAASVLRALFAAPSGRSERELRADYARAFPRATAAFGRGFSIDTMRVVPGANGTTAVTLTIGFHPETMKPIFPAFADYLDRYAGSAKYRMALTDGNGAVILDAVGQNRAFTVRYRLQGGELVTLNGPPRPMSDSLQLTTSASLRVKRMTVGFRDLVTDFVINNRETTNGRERSWTIVARRAPDWDLPLGTERLIRTPLARPFTGAGIIFRIGVRDSTGGQTVIARRTRVEVQESAILRFLGAISSHIAGEFDGRVEFEESRFLREGFAALREDVRALAAGRLWRGEIENATGH